MQTRETSGGATGRRDRNIKVLNALIETTIDSVDGYERAAEVVEAGGVSDVFRHFAAERREAVQRLREQVRRLGGKPRDDGSILAAAHRAFLDLRSAIQSDRQAAIAEVERGEDFLRSQFEDALENPDLDPAVQAVIRQCYETVRRGHDAAAYLRRALPS